MNVASMTSRRIGLPSLVRLLGNWRGDDARGATYRRLADGLRLLILDGRLPLDVRVPGERDMASALGVSRTTVSAAFELLRAQGYLLSRQGSSSRTAIPPGPGHRLGLPDDPTERAGIINFAVAALPASDAVHAAYAAALAALPAHLPSHGYERVGLAALRAVLAERYTKRGLPTSPDQILVTHGAQHGLALLLRLLTGPGDRVVIDHPTYPNAIDAIRHAACRPIPVGLPAHGWDVDAIEAAFRQTGPRFAYFIPDFHNPTGRYMDQATRAAVADAAARTKTILVFDETLADLWLDAPPEANGAGSTDDQAIRLGSTGKSFWGGLRIGWIRADVATIAALAAARASLDLGTPILEQLAAAALLADDHASLEVRRAALRARRRHLLALVADRLPDWKTVSPPGGLSLWAELPAPLSSALAAMAEHHGVRVAAGPRFGVDCAFERFIRLPFTLPEPELSEAVERLALGYAQLRPPASTARDVGTSGAGIDAVV